MTAPRPLRAVIWCAVSTKSQAEEEKASLPQQRAAAEAACVTHGWQVAAVLEVPGHSRNYITLDECIRDAEQVGIFAFSQLRDLIAARAFDVLIVRDGDRFAREQSMHAEIVIRVIRAGAMLYITSQQRLITANDYREFIALDGLMAAKENDRKTQRWLMGARRRAERGLPHSKPPFGYRYVRNPHGRAVRIELREDTRRALDDLARLILAGKSWRQISIDMAALGHQHPDSGITLNSTSWRRVAHAPEIFGAAVLGNVDQQGIWAFDPDEPVPDGIYLVRTPNPPIPHAWDEQTEGAIKAELRRRARVIRGRASPEHTHKFTGLLRCGVCGLSMTHKHKRRLDGKYYHHYGCFSHNTEPATYPERCGNPTINERVVITQVDAFLKRILKRDLDAGYLMDELLLPKDLANVGRAQQLEADMERIKAQIGTLIVRQSNAPANVQEIYAQQIAQLSERLDKLHVELREVRASMESRELQANRKAALKALATMDLSTFWSLPNRQINQFLHRLLGKHRFVVKKKQIVGID